MTKDTVKTASAQIIEKIKQRLTKKIKKKAKKNQNK